MGVECGMGGIVKEGAGRVAPEHEIVPRSRVVTPNGGADAKAGEFWGRGEWGATEVERSAEYRSAAMA